LTNYRNRQLQTCGVLFLLNCKLKASMMTHVNSFAGHQLSHDCSVELIGLTKGGLKMVQVQLQLAQSRQSSC